MRQNASAEPPAINTLSSQVCMCLLKVLIQLGLCIVQLGCNSQLIGTASMGLEWQQNLHEPAYQSVCWRTWRRYRRSIVDLEISLRFPWGKNCKCWRWFKKWRFSTPGLIYYVEWIRSQENLYKRISRNMVFSDPGCSENCSASITWSNLKWGSYRHPIQGGRI